MVAIKQQRRGSEEAGREMLIYDSLPRHPNLLCLLDKFVMEPYLNLVFEYLHSSLQDVFHRAQGLLEVPVAKQYSRQVLVGLQHLHLHNIAHRDLSMGNICLDIPSNTINIADMGLAVSASSFVLTRTVHTL